VIKIKVDIVGGSFGGLSAAISLKEINKSIDVIVHEKHKEIGYNHEGRRCGEAIMKVGDAVKLILLKKSGINGFLRIKVFLMKLK